jgi:lipopolysaccharide export system protein LptA
LSKNIIVVPAIIAFIAVASCAALAADSLSKAKSSAEPVVVTARSLVADNHKKTVIYKKDVVVKRGDVTLYADEVTIQLASGGQAADKKAADPIQGSGKIDTINAKGNVRIIQQDRTATSDEAVFYNGAEKFVLTGRPRVWQGDNVLTGIKITYNLKDDTILVDEAKTILYQQDKGKDEAAAPEGK